MNWQNLTFIKLEGLLCKFNKFNTNKWTIFMMCSGRLPAWNWFTKSPTSLLVLKRKLFKHTLYKSYRCFSCCREKSDGIQFLEIVTKGRTTDKTKCENIWQPTHVHGAGQLCIQISFTDSVLLCVHGTTHVKLLT